MDNEVSFVISSKIALHTAMPYIYELHKRGVKVHYIISDDIINEIKNIQKNEDNIILIKDINKQTIKLKKMFFLILALITDKSFSPSYKRWLNNQILSKKSYYKLLNYIIFLSPKVKKSNINRYLTEIFTIFNTKNILPTKKVINITINTIPHLLANKKYNIYTILESWDHPGKSPIGYISKKVFLWNKYLKKDWQEYQNDKKILYSYPIKLAYAIDDKLKRNDSNIIMYPAVTSSDSMSYLYNEEIKFLHQLCKIIENTNYILYIKPKPNTKIGDLDEFLKYKNVQIGHYQQNDGGSSYSLSDEYNLKRLKELDKCKFVINTGTTFAMDAAAYGIPVLQLKFTKVKEYKVFSAFETFPHLNNHLFNKKDLIFKLTNDKPIETQLLNILNNPNTVKKAEKFRDYLRDWLIPNETMEESVSRVIDEILKDE